MGIPRVYTYSDGWIDDKIDVASGFAEPLKEYCFTVHNIGYPSSSISMHYSALKNWILFILFKWIFCLFYLHTKCDFVMDASSADLMMQWCCNVTVFMWQPSKHQRPGHKLWQWGTIFAIFTRDICFHHLVSSTLGCSKNSIKCCCRLVTGNLIPIFWSFFDESQKE